MIPILLIHPSPEKRALKIEEMIGERGYSKNHPDLMWLGAEEKLGIEQSRKIQEFLSLKPYQSEGVCVAVVGAENLTLEAQNSLLKSLEEPPPKALIILGSSSEDQLLPTLISRCEIRNLESDKTEEDKSKVQEQIRELLDSTFEKRFQFIEKLDDREDFLEDLTAYFRKLLLEKSTNDIEGEFKIYHQFLKDLIMAQKWSNQNVNIRAILEYLMLKMEEGK